MKNSYFNAIYNICEALRAAGIPFEMQDGIICYPKDNDDIIASVSVKDERHFEIIWYDTDIRVTRSASEVVKIISAFHNRDNENTFVVNTKCKWFYGEHNEIMDSMIRYLKGVEVVSEFHGILEVKATPEMASLLEDARDANLIAISARGGTLENTGVWIW